MGRQPNASELAAGGISAMEAMHAVVDMASAPSDRMTVMIGRFHALVRMTEDTGNEHGLRGLRTALARLLYVSTQTLGLPAQARAGGATSQTQLHKSVMQLIPGQDPDVQKIMVTASECRSVADFLRVVINGSAATTTPTTLGNAAAVVLREVLRTRGGVSDPMRRWVILGQLTSTVVTAHYLQGITIRPAV